MPDITTLTLFVSASIAVILAPGPASIHVLTKSINNGKRAGFSATCGTCTGLLIHTSAAVIGLSAILRTSVIAYTIVKYVGAIYLLYLGIRTLKHNETFDFHSSDSESTMPESYKQGVIINTLNPKVAVFFLAFLPQFAGTWLQMLLLGVLYMTLAFLYQSTLATLSDKIRTLLEKRPSVTDRIRQVAGIVFVGFSIELVLSNI
jgi:threonine/homoserine/homoserine lactone efflux protein